MYTSDIHGKEERLRDLYIGNGGRLRDNRIIGVTSVTARVPPAKKKIAWDSLVLCYFGIFLGKKKKKEGC